MSEPFFRHLFPPQYRVLGHVLPPLSLWHLAALEAIGSPLLASEPGHTAELGDLQAAIRICLTRWPDQPDLRPTLRDWWQQFLHRKDRRYLRDHAEAFHAYLQIHTTPPELWKGEGEIPRLISAPSVLSRVAGLSELPAFTLNDIWNNVTPGYAYWHLCAIAERDPSLSVRFAREEDEEESDLPDLEQQSDEELYQLALRELGKDRADCWLAARQESRRNGTLHQPSSI